MISNARSQSYTWRQIIAVFCLLYFAGFLQTRESTAAESNRWLLLCCGLPGDDGHRERLTEACEKIIAAAEPVLGIGSQRLRVLVGDESMRESLQYDQEKVEICTRESVAAALATLGEQIQAEDECWVILLGHANLYDGISQFNVLGKDFDQTEFANWASALKSKQQVFLLTTPVSGFWIKPLANESRIIITATEADLEFTGTEMPYALADILAGEGESQTLEDIDGDESLSLLDLYLAVSLEVHDRFKSQERLSTEHAQLDDNGDGRGNEVQQAYLPLDEADESSGKPDRPKPIDVPTLDGYRSRQILVRRIK